MSWGESGTDPGEFNIAHNICCDADGWVYVADRENHRVQIFDGKGKLRDAVERSAPAERAVPRARVVPVCYIGEGGPAWAINRDWLEDRPRVSVHAKKDDEMLARLGKPDAGIAPGQFTSPHGIAVDQRGNIYAGELSGRSWSRFSNDSARP